MDVFAKAVKSGISKGYAIGQQQLQQRLAKEKNSGDISGQDAGRNSTTQIADQYKPTQPTQPSQPSPSRTAPPLPPRQYPAQYTPEAPNLPSLIETHTAADGDTVYSIRPEHAYSSIMPPPPPPPTYEPLQTETTSTVYHQDYNAASYNSNRRYEAAGGVYEQTVHQRLEPQPMVAAYLRPPAVAMEQHHAEQHLPPVPAKPQEYIENTSSRLHQTLTETSVEQRMANLSLSPLKNEPTSNAEMDQQRSKFAKLPRIEKDGPEADVVRFCPGSRVVDYPLYWYYMEDMPDAPICTRCHADDVENTALSSQFTKKLAAKDSKSSCNFRFSRVQNVIWKAALKSGSLDQLKSFLVKRRLIPNCRGRETTTAAGGVKYFGIKDGEIDSFIACEACYEDHIVGASFEARFIPFGRQQGPNDRWACDMSIPYLPKALAKFAPQNNWSAFIENARRRFKLAACDGRELARGDSGSWYTTRTPWDGFQVCEACYMDRVELDHFAGEYEQMPGPVDFDMYIVFLRQRWRCSLAGGTLLAMTAALDAAQKKGDFATFREAADRILKLVPCTKDGIIGGELWTLEGGCDDFDVCEACYVGIVKTNGLDRFMEHKERKPEDAAVCDFCPAAPRYEKYMNKFAETLDRGVFRCYEEYVRTYAGVPACPGRGTRQNGTWWGYNEALFCENCHLDFVRHTSLSAHMPLQRIRDARAQICQIWSPRMRAMWLSACDAGAPNTPSSTAALQKLRDFDSKRLKVYLQTVPRIEFIQTMRDMRTMQAMQQGQLSLMYSGMNSIAAISGADDGSWHGSSSLGWYETENGATGARMWRDMQEGMADARRGDEEMEMMRLEVLWREVE